MRTEAIVMAMALAAAAGQCAGASSFAEDRTVTVCMPRLLNMAEDVHARLVASRIFAGIGVRIRWREGIRGCPPEGIMISITDQTPATLKPHALAYALPYEGTHIRVFHDRIVLCYGNIHAACVLGHVIAHEITHILQGVCRHSESGIMKPAWDPEDVAAMSWKPLRFTDEDVDLIYRGMAARLRTALAKNGAPPAAVPQPAAPAFRTELR